MIPRHKAPWGTCQNETSCFLQPLCNAWNDSCQTCRKLTKHRSEFPQSLPCQSGKELSKQPRWLWSRREAMWWLERLVLWAFHCWKEPLWGWQGLGELHIRCAHVPPSHICCCAVLLSCTPNAPAPPRRNCTACKLRGRSCQNACVNHKNHLHSEVEQVFREKWCLSLFFIPESQNSFMRYKTENWRIKSFELTSLFLAEDLVGKFTFASQSYSVLESDGFLEVDVLFHRSPPWVPIRVYSCS